MKFFKLGDFRFAKNNYWKKRWIMKKFVKKFFGKRLVWDLYMKMDSLSAAFVYARFCKQMQDMTSFGKKNCLSRYSLAWKFFNDEKDIAKGDERIYTYADKHIGHLARQFVEGGKIGSFNRVFEAPLAQKMRNIKEEFELFANKTVKV